MIFFSWNFRVYSRHSRASGDSFGFRISGLCQSIWSNVLTVELMPVNFVGEASNHLNSFGASVPPGHYKVSIKGKRPGIGRYGPFEVDVAPGKMTRVQWDCDSGIR